MHCHTVDVRAVTPEEGECFIALKIKFQKGRYKFQIENYFRTPRHSVSSVLVAHNLAVASSLPVTSIEPSSWWFQMVSNMFPARTKLTERHMQLMLSSWSAIVSSSSPFFPPVLPPAPIFQLAYTSTPAQQHEAMKRTATDMLFIFPHWPHVLD